MSLPLFSWLELGWIALTVVVYALMLGVFRRTAGALWAHPLPLSALATGLIVWLMDTPVADYQSHTRLLHFMLGPATVALAVPLFQQIRSVREQGRRLSVPILVGGAVAPLSALALLWVFDTPWDLGLPMTVKSITTPLAMAVTEAAGGIAGLAAVYVILTGIVGGVLAASVFRRLNVTDAAHRGLALGTVAHAIGTAQAVQEGPRTAAFATLALVFNGIVTAIVVPLVMFFVS